eukprot:7866213-Alexandrium_andersonii.AAC.1
MALHTQRSALPAVGFLCDLGGGIHARPNGGQLDRSSLPWREVRACPACVQPTATSWMCRSWSSGR